MLPVADSPSHLLDENRRLRALVEFGRTLTAERDLPAQLRLVCSEVQRTVGCAAAAVVLRDAAGALEAVEQVGMPPALEEAWQHALRRGDLSDVAEAGIQGRPLIVADLASAHGPTSLRAALLEAGLRHMLAVPLEFGQDLQGSLITWSDQPAEADADEVAALGALADAVIVPIQHARLYAQSQRELRRRDALRNVVASISSELDNDSLLGRVVAHAVELLEADSGMLSLLDVGGTARIRAVHNLPRHLVGSAVAPGHGLAGQVLLSCAPLSMGCPQAADLLPVPRPLPEIECLCAGIAVPIWWQGQLTGVFGVLSGDPRRTFTAEDQQTMEVLANHVAIAIENARLYGEVRDRLAEVTGLQAATTALVEELQPERALRVVAEQALALASAATVSIELLRPDGLELEVQVAVGEHALELHAMRVPVESSVAGAAVASGRPQINRADGRSQLVLPLRARNHTLGTLSAFTHHPNAFHSRQVELLATFANQAAISLDNARLYTELQSRLEEMVGLQRLGTLLLEEHDFDRVLRSICLQLQRLTDAGGVGIALLEEDPRYLEMRTVVGPSAHVLLGARIPTEGSFAAEALRTNRPQRSNDAQNDPRGYKRSLVLGNTRTILSVPMKTRQRTVGVLSIYNKEGSGGFTDRDAELATFFANQAAAAIENARLYEQTREYAVIEERTRLARDLHDSVTQSLFSVTLLSEAGLSLLGRDPVRARERFERANELAHGALAEMRALIFQLRPMALQEEGLLQALKKHLAALRSRHARVVELQVTGEARRLPAPIEEAAFGIIQESLNNVIKHSGASRAQVELAFERDVLRLAAVDNGVGFEPDRPRRADALGMASMRERAEAVSGRLTIESAPGQGTRVAAELPVAHAD